MGGEFFFLYVVRLFFFFFFSSRRRHTRSLCDWSSDVCSSDLAMTMADQIAVMNQGRIEQLGTPTDLYETPATAYVASFLGASNLIAGTVSGADTIRLGNGAEVKVLPAALDGRTGHVAVGIRPGKIELGAGQENTMEGPVAEPPDVGVATQYLVDTECGRLTVYRQNASPGLNGAAPGQRLTLSWSPESTFVVDSMEGSE